MFLSYTDIRASTVFIASVSLDLSRIRPYWIQCMVMLYVATVPKCHKIYSFFMVCFVGIKCFPSGFHYSDVITRAMTTLITGVSIVCSIAFSGAYRRKHQSSASLAFARGIHFWPVVPLTKGQYRGKCFHLMTSSWYEPFQDICHCFIDKGRTVSPLIRLTLFNDYAYY